MKKLLPFALCLLACVSFAFCGCTQQTKTFDMPKSEQAITSNGALAVSKGDYLYFVAGYEEHSVAKKEYTEVKESAIYKAVVADGKLTKVEKFVNYVCGYEYGGLYIFGDYLYFASPETGKDNKGAVRNDLLKIMRVKLDGSEEKVLFTTDKAVSSSSWWTMTSTNNAVFAVVYNENKITKININGDTVKTTVVKDKNISSAYKADKFVVFTETIEKENGLYTSGNVIKKLDIASSIVSTLKDCTIDGKSATIKGYSNGFALYTLDGMTFAINLETNEVTKVFSGEFTSFEITSAGKLVFEFNDQLFIKDINSSFVTNEANRITSDNVTLVKTIGDTVYYIYDSNFYKKSLTTLTSEAVKIAKTGTLCESLLDDFDNVSVSGLNLVCFVSKLESATANTLCVYDTVKGEFYNIEYDTENKTVKSTLKTLE